MGSRKRNEACRAIKDQIDVTENKVYLRNGEKMP